MGSKAATLESVMTCPRIATVRREHPDKLLITGEDRFLGYSLMMGARAALIGMGAALTDVQARLLHTFAHGDTDAFLGLSVQVDAFSQATFTAPMEGYIRRMLWALAADGVIDAEACDDPWGPALSFEDRQAVVRAVREVRDACYGDARSSKRALGSRSLCFLAEEGVAGVAWGSERAYTSYGGGEVVGR